MFYLTDYLSGEGYLSREALLFSVEGGVGLSISSLFYDSLDFGFSDIFRIFLSSYSTYFFGGFFVTEVSVFLSSAGLLMDFDFDTFSGDLDDSLLDYALSYSLAFDGGRVVLFFGVEGAEGLSVF